MCYSALPQTSDWLGKCLVWCEAVCTSLQSCCKYHAYGSALGDKCEVGVSRSCHHSAARAAIKKSRPDTTIVRKKRYVSISHCQETCMSTLKISTSSFMESTKHMRAMQTTSIFEDKGGSPRCCISFGCQVEVVNSQMQHHLPIIPPTRVEKTKSRVDSEYVGFVGC